ncbi:hypothetical protein PBY51_014757 [Eleginops maclovinus]|uniref:Uncharacterized protein n=1 Tax=Eleginops maclovinus TaxID=56733 RepID=A0AAN8AG05_ELEMC|nr:hypothetical protein PBY51_014757 [Eleginops maclovinus]
MRVKDQLSTKTQWQQYLLCQLVPHQFEEVESAPGRMCLARSYYRRSTGQSQTLGPAGFSLGASQGAAGAWGIQAPELHPLNPWEVGELTLTGSNCQLAKQRRGKRGDRGQEERGEERGSSSRRGEEERRRMTRG